VPWSINPLLGFTLLNQAELLLDPNRNYGSHIRVVNSHILYENFTVTVSPFALKLRANTTGVCGESPL